MPTAWMATEGSAGPQGERQAREESWAAGAAVCEMNVFRGPIRSRAGGRAGGHRQQPAAARSITEGSIGGVGWSVCQINYTVLNNT